LAEIPGGRKPASRSRLVGELKIHSPSASPSVSPGASAMLGLGLPSGQSGSARCELRAKVRAATAKEIQSSSVIGFTSGFVDGQTRNGGFSLTPRVAAVGLGTSSTGHGILHQVPFIAIVSKGIASWLLRAGISAQGDSSVESFLMISRSVRDSRLCLIIDHFRWITSGSGPRRVAWGSFCTFWPCVFWPGSGLSFSGQATWAALYFLDWVSWTGGRGMLCRLRTRLRIIAAGSGENRAAYFHVRKFGYAKVAELPGLALPGRDGHNWGDMAMFCAL
jgi:hypothetical protein